MKHKIIATLFSILIFTMSNAQSVTPQKNNAFSFEIGKTRLIFNINFDHTFSNKNVGFRINTGAYFFSKYLHATTVGAGGYYLVGNKADFLELGIDLSLLSVTQDSDDQLGVPLLYPNYPVSTFYPSTNIGYRRHGKKTLLRIGVSPGLIKNGFLPGGYISYGFTF